MASILRVNTLTDASSGNSTAMSTINQGTAKSWINFNGTGTIAARDSYNVSSLVDNGTGNYDQVFTNNMSSANYSVSGAIADNAPIASNRDRYFMAVSESASQINLNAFGQADMNFVYGQVFGDLA